jgi:hypothetical protein
MNQDKYPGIYAAMGEMDTWRNERFPMDYVETRRHERLPVGEMEMRRYERQPIAETAMRYQENAKTECIDSEQVIEDPKLAHAYVPIQKFCPTFTPITALRKGTVFPGLVNVYGWENKEFGGEYL